MAKRAARRSSVSERNLVLADAILSPRGNPRWVDTAMAELGVRDYPGPRYNPRVVEYLATTGYEDNDDETSWCSAFVNWTLAQNAIRGTNSAAARSWLNFGQRLVEPRPGCIVILWRESPQSWKGHVGFFAGWDVGHRVRLLGGNQGGGSDWDEVCVTNFPDERILGFRWPAGV
ncbi:TIGR02594 family protein [Bradyrhizobium sp. LB14.3]|uniref:TIGR02594 family protein n=1 Tax=Bradyrhizobium sp. LB14.3 TaxID=3156328 RepID=UPI00339A9587